MRLAQLQQLASSMGITGTAKMRKSDLVAAIRAQQSGSSAEQPAKAPQPTKLGAPAKDHGPLHGRDHSPTVSNLAFPPFCLLFGLLV